MTTKTSTPNILVAAVLFLVMAESAGALQGGASEVTAKAYPPRVLRVFPPKAGIYTSQTAMEFRIRFSKPVYVEGEPSLPVEIGTALREGKYVGGSGSRVLKFKVTPHAGDRAVKGVRLINALLSDGGNVVLGRTGIPADVALHEQTLASVIVDDLLPASDVCSYVTTINGAAPPLVAASAKKSEVVNDRLMQAGDGNARRSLVIKTTRAPGTRAPIHEHEFSGTTTVVQGEMTLYMEGHEPMKAVAGESYFMPPGHTMTGVNTGNQDAIMYDSYVLPTYARNWRPVEPGFIECVSK